MTPLPNLPPQGGKELSEFAAAPMREIKCDRPHHFASPMRRMAQVTITVSSAITRKAMAAV